MLSTYIQAYRFLHISPNLLNKCHRLSVLKPHGAQITRRNNRLYCIKSNPTLISMIQPQINLQSDLHSKNFDLGHHLEVTCNARYRFLDLCDVYAYHLQTLLAIDSECSVVKSVQDVRLKNVRFRSSFRTCFRFNNGPTMASVNASFSRSIWVLYLTSFFFRSLFCVVCWSCVK